MPEYVIKIGEVQLRSKTPITEQERVEAIRLLLKNARLFGTATGEVVAYVSSKE